MESLIVSSTLVGRAQRLERFKWIELAIELLSELKKKQKKRYLDNSDSC